MKTELVKNLCEEADRLRGLLVEPSLREAADGIRELEAALKNAITMFADEKARLEAALAEAIRVRDNATKGTVLWRTDWRAERDRAEQAEAEIARLSAVIERLEAEYQAQKAENARIEGLQAENARLQLALTPRQHFLMYEVERLKAVDADNMRLRAELNSRAALAAEEER